MTSKPTVPAVRLCRHPYITVFAEENGPHRMWACDACNIRFYPACEVCVSIGHRGEVHVEDPHHEWIDSCSDCGWKREEP
jgi:hypothetical protein